MGSLEPPVVTRGLVPGFLVVLEQFQSRLQSHVPSLLAYHRVKFPRSVLPSKN